MFNQGYTFRRAQTKGGNSRDVFKFIHIFSFVGKHGVKYIVEAEEYDFYIYIVKFHLMKAHSQFDDRYNRLTHLNDVPRVLRTCLDIMIALYQENSHASFGFVGAPLENESKESNNKRFRVYSRIMENFFSRQKFSHFTNEKNNFYLLINKDYEVVEPNLETKIINMFHHYYNFEI